MGAGGILLGVTLRWTSTPSRGEKLFSQLLQHWIKPYGPSKARSLTLPVFLATSLGKDGIIVSDHHQPNRPTSTTTQGTEFDRELMGLNGFFFQHVYTSINYLDNFSALQCTQGHSCTCKIQPYLHTSHLLHMCCCSPNIRRDLLKKDKNNALPQRKKQRKKSKITAIDYQACLQLAPLRFAFQLVLSRKQR